MQTVIQKKSNTRHLTSSISPLFYRTINISLTPEIFCLLFHNNQNSVSNTKTAQYQNNPATILLSATITLLPLALPKATPPQIAYTDTAYTELNRNHALEAIIALASYPISKQH
jgi:hypothetical protein